MPSTSTISLLGSMEWAKRFNFGRHAALSDFMEPAITSANITMQTILGAPFAWRWNREILTGTLVSGNQDVLIPTSDFGWIELASVLDPVNTKWYQAEASICLALDSSPGRPRFISAQIDDGAGNLIFRGNMTADHNYPLSITIQKRPPLFTSLKQTWSPIPDEYSHIYQWGFLFFMWLFADDPRAPLANQKFVTQLLSANEGLTETERNIWLNNWQYVTGHPIGAANRLMQGEQSRQV